MSDSRISYSTVERFVSKTQQEILLRWWFRVKGHANVALLEFKRGDKLRSYAFAIAHILAASSFVYTTYIVYNVQLRKDREACVQAEAGAAESEGTFSMLGCIMANSVRHPSRRQYLDPIIAATYSEDGAVDDVCKALSPRLREPNTVVRKLEIMRAGVTSSNAKLRYCRLSSRRSLYYTR